ncbi:hypothetical protein KGP45_00750 [Pediococcus ethanolidurans]|uniref:hypothetical protein n=1 Tax=Pediococcus ethanolidurans TaxID=319653 RepID=UPI001C1EC657|nr:hypothetical protein [Pediococcus ethanolidurans]MBU7562673.1 hypothetical protein [Pediococcus ethanolidurans]
MAEIASFGVNIDENTLLAQNAQNTADSAAGGITNLNDPNLMSVIEKQYNISQFAGLTSQYNVIMQNAKDDGIDTTALTTAYNNLNQFMAGVLADPDHASDIDRAAYKKYQDAYNEELANIQSALQDNTNNKFNSATSATSQAASTASLASSQAQSAVDYASSEATVQSTATAKAQSTADNAFSQAQAVGSQASAGISSNSTATAKAQSTADNAFSQAQAVGSQASADIVVQSSATAKAQSTADNAFSQATTAIDTGKVTSQAVTDLKDGSKLTIADLENGLATKVANSEYASYKTQTASQIASKVDTGNFSTYKTQTADLIASKVAASDFSAYQATTAKAISSKVESSDFNTYKTQTSDLIDDKVSSSEYESDKTQTASEIADKVSSDDFSTYKTQTDKLIGQKVDDGDFKTYQAQTSKLIESKVDNGTYQSDKTQTSSDIASKVSSDDFNSYKTQTDKLIQSKVSSADFNSLTISNRNLALGTATAFKMTGQNKVNQSQNAYQFSRVIPKGTLVTVTFDIASSTGVGTYTMQFSGQDTGSSWQAISNGNLVKGTKHISVPLTTDSDYLNFSARIDNATGDITVSNLIVSESSKEVDWTPAPEDQATQSQITQLSGEITQKVNSGDFNSYKTQTDKLIGQKVDNGDFSTYKTQTADAISSKVATKDFKAYQATTAKSIESKVESSDFNTYKQQTADAISSKVANSDFSTYKTQTAKDINLRVTKGDLIDQINIQAGNTLISSSGQLTLSGKTIYFDTTNPVIIPSANIDTLLTRKTLKAADITANTFSTNNETFTVDKYGAITAKNMTINGGTLTSPTINASTINSSTINGTMFNAGSRIDNSNNTSNWYPLTINPDGDLTSTHIENGAGLQTYISGGTVNTRYNRFATNGYGQYTSNFISMGGDGSIAVTSNGTTNKDTAFNAPIASTYGAVYITPGGISLHGDNESLRFRGTSKIGTNGMRMDNYGNVHGGGASKWWRVYDSSGSHVASFGTAPGNNIAFLKPLLVDEIGGYSSNNGHALLIHGDDAGKSGSTGQMAFKKDSRSALVTSASIYNRTYSSGSNVYITSHGTLGRSTSASKYKYNIKHAIDEDSLADKLLTMHVSTWNDKHAVDSYAQTLTDNTESEDISIKDNYGLIAEDLRDAGLDMFVEYGKNHTIEGIEYDRAWLPLLPKMRQMNDKINEYELRISKLEAKINE